MKLARSFVAIMAVAALVACDEDPTDPEEVSLAGTYTVSTFAYQADAGGDPVNLALIPAGSGGPYGITTMTVAADNSFNGSLRLPTANGPVAFPIGGDITLSGSNGISIEFDAATNALDQLDPVEAGTYSMVGNTLTITLPDVTFDFGALVGTPTGDTPSSLTIVGTRS